MSKLSLSVIMPALNEEENIRDAISSTLNAFSLYGINGEVVVINDGSTDRTKEIVEEAAKEDGRVRLINHDTPQGIGASFFEGAINSDNDVVVMFPGDNENDAESALCFYDTLEKVDILVPFIHNVEVRDRLRRVISSIYRFIINISFGINLNYTNGTVFYRRCIFDNVELKSHGFFYQAELLIKLIRKGYLFAEIPNMLLVRNSGESKATTLKSLINVIKNYVNLLIDIHIKRVESRKDYRKLNINSVAYKMYSKLEQNSR